MLSALQSAFNYGKRLATKPRTNNSPFSVNGGGGASFSAIPRIGAHGVNKAPAQPPAGPAVGSFNGPVQFRKPGDPYGANDLKIPLTPLSKQPYNPVYGPTLPPGATPKPTAAKAPAGFNYSQVNTPQSPATVNTAVVNPSKSIGIAGFSQDPNSGYSAATQEAMNQPTNPNLPPDLNTQGDVAPPPTNGYGGTGNGSGINSSLLSRVANTELEKYRAQVLAAMSPGEQERALADQLAQFQGDARMGISGLEGQGRGIPLGLVRGQQAQLAEQAGIQEQTLLGRLNAAQQARSGELAAAQAQLGFEEADIAKEEAFQAAQAAKEEAFQAAQAAGMKPIEVGGNLVALNPETGQYETVYQAPAEAVDPWDSAKKEAEIAKIDAETAKLQNELLGITDPYERAMKEAQLNNVLLQGDKLRQEVETGAFEASGNLNPKEQSALRGKLQSTDRALGALDLLENSPALNGAVGFQSGLPTIPGTGKADFEAQFKAFKAALSVPEIDKLRGLGAMSDRELAIVTDAVTGLSLSMSQKTFKEEINRIRASLEVTKMAQSLGIAGYTPEEIDEYLIESGFNSAPSRAVKGSTKVAVAAMKKPEGSAGGQCGRFVNNLTGIGMGDSFGSKQSKCDPSIGTNRNPPKPGDVFVMPYSWTGHTGIVRKVTPLANGTWDLEVVDSNYGLDEKVRHHTLNSASISGYARVPLKA